MAKIKLKKLEEYLQTVDGFEKPKILLEQYQTPAHIASVMLYEIQTKFDSIENKIVADLGCGCGMLSIGSSLLGAQHTVGFELDEAAIEIFRNNISEIEIPSVECIKADINNICVRDNTFDTVVMNPPFGTKKNSGMDMRFLEIAARLSKFSVYSLHKTSTREYILKKTKSWGLKGEVMAVLKFNIDAAYKFHKKTSVDIEVDLWMFDVTDKNL